MDGYQPVRFFDRGTCPKCKQSLLILLRHESETIALDRNGWPGAHLGGSIGERVVCPNCLYKSPVDSSFVDTEEVDPEAEFMCTLDGKYKYVTEAERIYEVNRYKEHVKYMAEKYECKSLDKDENPFMEEE